MALVEIPDKYAEGAFILDMHIDGYVPMLPRYKESLARLRLAPDAMFYRRNDGSMGIHRIERCDGEEAGKPNPEAAAATSTPLSVEKRPEDSDPSLAPYDVFVAYSAEARPETRQWDSNLSTMINAVGFPDSLVMPICSVGRAIFVCPRLGPPGRMDASKSSPSVGEEKKATQPALPQGGGASSAVKLKEIPIVRKISYRYDKGGASQAAPTEEDEWHRARLGHMVTSEDWRLLYPVFDEWIFFAPDFDTDEAHRSPPDLVVFFAECSHATSDKMFVVAELSAFMRRNGYARNDAIAALASQIGDILCASDKFMTWQEAEDALTADEREDSVIAIFRVLGPKSVPRAVVAERVAEEKRHSNDEDGAAPVAEKAADPLRQ